MNIVLFLSKKKLSLNNKKANHWNLQHSKVTRKTIKNSIVNCHHKTRGQNNFSTMQGEWKKERRDYKNINKDKDSSWPSMHN